MKKIITMLCFFFIVLCLFSCDDGSLAGDSSLPDFVLNPPATDDTYFYGIGYGNQSTFTLSKTIGITNAKADIARQIAELIQAVVESYAQNAGISDDSAVSSFVDSMSYAVCDDALTYTVTQTFEQTDDGGIWVLERCAISDITSAVETAFANHGNTDFTGLTSSQALVLFNEELSNNFPQSEPVQ